MKYFMLLTALVIVNTCFAQQTLVTDSIGSVLITKDVRLDLLSAKQSEINRRAMMNTTKHVSGYRIQVINTPSRTDANNVKADMLRMFPELKSYLLYKAPNYRVRVGNFLTRRDAENTRQMITSLYPNRGIYLISDIIEYKPSDDLEGNE